MKRPALTVRLPESTQSALRLLSKIERRPVNQLVVTAIDSYLRQSGEAEKDLSATLAALNRYRQEDPDYSKAISSFVEAEAAGGKTDPLEGTVFLEDAEVGTLKIPHPEGLHARLG